jgi:V8-like Glu-specific endopeptidase
MALVALRTPFKEVLPLGWKQCPTNGEKVMIHVVGYPLDLPGGSNGRYMYESTGPADWDLEEDNMIIHRLDTFQGKQPQLFWDTRTHVFQEVQAHQSSILEKIKELKSSESKFALPKSLTQTKRVGSIE